MESQGPVRFDLSPKAEADQREQQDLVFNFAVLPVLPVLFDPEPLEQSSNGSAPRAEPSERTKQELKSELLEN